MRSTRQTRQTGFALLPVVLTLALLAATAYLMTRESAMGGALVASAQRQDAARYMAEAALRHASWQVQTSNCSSFSDVSTTSFGEGSYAATVTPTSGSPVTLSATGTAGDGTSRTLSREGVQVYETAANTILQPDAAEGKDTFLYQWKPNWNYGAGSTLDAGDNGTDSSWHALLQFDLAAIPDSVHILFATLELYSTAPSFNGGPLGVRRVDHGWVEGTGTGSSGSGATWVEAGAGTGLWGTPGGDLDPTPFASTNVPQAIGWNSWDITSLVAGWVAGDYENDGLALVHDAPWAQGRFASSDHTDSTLHPKLTIVYACECGNTCGATQGPAGSFWFSTVTDVSASGAPGLDSWDKEDVIAFADPNLALEPGVTSGTFSLALNLSSFAADDSAVINAIHHVDSNLTVGGANSVDLSKGDVLLSTSDVETLTSTNSISVNPEDVFVFQPATPGDYSSGTFIFLIDGSQIVDGSIVGISLVEKNTVVGDTSLSKGSFLMALTNRRDVMRFAADDVGLGTTVGAVTELIDGPTLSLGSEIRGLDLAEDALSIGGHAVASGSILLTLNNDDADGVGDNAVAADAADVFYLTVTQTGASPVADATLLFEGADVNLDSIEEELQALTLVESLAATGGGTPLLYVVKDPDNPSVQELARESLMQGWGFGVTLFDDDDTPASFISAAADHDVAYVSQEALEGSLGTKLVDAAIGVVNESRDMIDVFGFATSASAGGGLPTLNVDPSHYITSVFPTEIVAPYGVNEWYQIASTPVGAGVQPVGAWIESPWTDLPALMALDAGADLFGGGTAAGRRVQIPMGAGQGLAPVDVNGLSDDGRTLIQRSILWARGEGCGSMTPLLLVVSDAASPTAQEAARRTLMESWCYAVTLIDDDAGAGEFAHEISLNEVIYISQEITVLSVADRVKDASIGVINEEYLISSDLGIGSGTGTGFFNDINLVDNTHYITSGFDPGALALFDPAYDIYTGTGFTLAPDLQVLGETGSITGLAALETGGALWDAGNAAGRRVLVPWGDDFSALNGDGRSLMQRSIEWAAGAGCASLQPVLLVVGDATFPLASRDAGRKQVIETGCFSVSVIDDGDTPTNFETAVAAADVVYVSGTSSGPALLDKLTGITKGVVNEVAGELDNFGFSSSTGGTLNADTFDKSDAALYISSPFSGGAVTALTTSVSMPVPSGTLAPGLQIPAGVTVSDPGVVILDTGAQRWDGNPAPARRVHLPLGPAETTQLTADGETLMRRSIEWAAGAGGGGGPSDPVTGGGAVVYEGFAEVNPSTTYNVDVPTTGGTVGGDLLIAAIASDEVSTDLAPPAGWQLIALQANSSRVTFGVWWKIASASEPATHTFTSSNYEMKYGWMMRFSGHDPTNPINATSSFDMGSSKNPPVPSTTTTVDNALILRVGGFDHQDITIDDSGLAGHTTITMDLGGSGLGACAGGAGYNHLATAGATGTAEFVLTGREEYVTGTIAIAPDPNPPSM